MFLQLRQLCTTHLGGAAVSIGVLHFSELQVAVTDRPVAGEDHLLVTGYDVEEELEMR